MKLFVVALLFVSAFALPEGMARFERMSSKDARSIPLEAQELSGQALVDYVNSKQTLFKAGLNKRFAHMTFEQKKRIIGGVMGPVEHDESVPLVDHSALDVDIPESFDSRTQWPNCPSIGHIRDQSACGSCWAFGSSEAISDRICIASNGEKQVSISADDILSCCGLRCGNGCNGGQPLEAWKWWVSTGVVTGSDYTENAGCKPYPFPPCEHHTNATTYDACPADEYSTPKCAKSCQDAYGVSYPIDKYYGKSAYGISKNVEDIQKEILTNGPVESSFNVFEDFESYTGGIYVHTAGRYLGGHAVKTIGWGVEDGTPYWLVANSWNEDWGEKGFFRIIRGQNECGFEGGMVAGLAK